MNNLPEIIKSQHDTVRFTEWLRNHTEITTLQGWSVSRMETGQVSKLGNHFADVNFMWSERRALNDWIRTYRKDNGDWWYD